MALFKRSHSKYWWMKFYFEGELVQESTKCTSRTKAEVIEAKRRVDLAEGKVDLKRKKTGSDIPTFKAFAVKFTELLKVNCGEASTAARQCFNVKLLTNYFGAARVDRIGKDDIEGYKIDRSKQTSRKTGEPMTRNAINLELITLKRMFSEMVELKIISTDPASKVKLLKKSDDKFHVITDEEERLYLMACPPQLQDVATIMLDTGMRCDEVYRIKKNEVFLDRGYLNVTKAKTEAGKRQVPLTATACEILLRRVERFQGEFLFPQNETDFSPATKQLHTKHAKVTHKLNLHFRLYDCRHTFATRMVEEYGVDLVTLSQLLGHSSLKMVARYSHPSAKHKTDAIRRMEARRNPPLRLVG